jgi:hypothetical protein
MVEKEDTIELIKSLKQSYKEILDIIKALANDNRLEISISLLSGKKKFEKLKEVTNLK